MLEEARMFVVRNLVRGTEQFLRLRPGLVDDVKLVGLESTASILEWKGDEEFPQQLLECRASAETSGLTSLLGMSPSDKVLVFTDGSWSAASVDAIDAWRSEDGSSVRFMKVGSDVHTGIAGPDVFAAEDLVSVLEEWLMR
jgi:hypothetical protein